MAKATFNQNAALVGDVLHGYAERGFLRGYADLPRVRTAASYRLTWHYNRSLDVRLDGRTCTLSFNSLLPAVPARSAMYAALRRFVAAFADESRPAHRQVDRRKAQLSCRSRSGNVSLSIEVLDGDFEYATRKLMHVANEIFLVFLRDGPYYEYRVQHLGLDPDGGWA